MELLLDTHAFIWWVNGSERLQPRARRAIEDNANVVFVSAASAWEIATKHRLGRLPGAGEIAPDVVGVIADQGFEGLPITLEEALQAGGLPGALSDPFDRMLIAQALERNLVLISNETLFDQYGIRRIW